MLTKGRSFFLFLLFCLLSCFGAASSLHAEEKSIRVHTSAKECGTCHPQHFKEWSASPHAYAQISPVFNAMHRTLVKRTNGTMGDFCIRCHTPQGMDNGEPIVAAAVDRSPVSLEGVTCITCHRREAPHGKVSGRLDLYHGDIFAPVYGSAGGEELDRVTSSKKYSVNTDPKKYGRNIHTAAQKNPQITTSAFCGTCHDVHSVGGFRLEEAFSEYKSSPAADDGHSCQDCHMGKEPGLPSGYDHAPVALVGGKPTKARKRTNHMFVGPDYSIVHPGIFPHNPAASELASIKEWLTFDYQAGWGTPDFEDTVSNSHSFPTKWADPFDRYEARELLEENFSLLEKVRTEREKLLQQGYQLGEIKVTEAQTDEIAFEVEFKNGTSGHNVPTGFDAERVVFLRVWVKDKKKRVVFRSGDLDPNGDLRDSHSLYVHNGELPLDPYLFSLQSRFLVNMVRGGEREQVLTVNYSPSPLPFVRPPTNATFLKGRPEGARKHRMTIPPLSNRWASYRVDEEQLKGSQGPYQITVQIVAGMVPVNLVYEIQDVGFDYGMSPREVAEAVVNGHQVLWEKKVKVDVPQGERQ